MIEQQQGVGTVSSDGLGQLPPQIDPAFDHAVGMIEPLDVRHAHDCGTGLLLRSPDLGSLRGRDAIDARFAAETSR